MQTYAPIYTALLRWLRPLFPSKALFRAIVLVSIIATTLFVAVAQNPRIEIQLKTPTVMIGEKISIQIRAFTNQLDATKLILPQDSTNGLLETLQFTISDTLDNRNGLQELKAEWVLIAFDSTDLVIPPIQMLVGQKLYTSPSIPIQVRYPANVDVQNPDKYYDIKDPWLQKYTWWDILYLILTSWYFYVCLALLFGWGVYRKFLKKVPKLATPTEYIPTPWERLRDKLNQIRAERRDDSEEIETAYNLMIDAFREFLNAQLDWDTYEKTASEIAESIRNNYPDTEELGTRISKWVQHSQWTRFAQYTLPWEEVLKDIDTLYLWSERVASVEPEKEKNSQI